MGQLQSAIDFFSYRLGGIRQCPSVTQLIFQFWIGGAGHRLRRECMKIRRQRGMAEYLERGLGTPTLTQYRSFEETGGGIPVDG